MVKHGGVKVTPRMLKYLAVPEGNKMVGIVSSVLQEALSLIDVKKWSKCMPADKFYELFHPYARESKSIVGLLRRAENVYLLAVTLGEGLERRSKEYFHHNEIFRGYIWDRLGSFLVEEEARKLDLDISCECQRNGLTATHRYSPGYRDFSIKAQQIFLDLVRNSIPGLKISSGYLLCPEKTVTAIKGVIKPEHHTMAIP